ncbi:MAG: hypothetical protein ACERKV_02980 [Clostridiaceae bacterium]
MKKKGILLMLIVSIIFVTIAIIYYKSNSHNKIQEDQSLITNIQSEANTSSYLDLDTVTDFKWDEVYIIPPYSVPETIIKDNNLKWTNINQSIKYHDNINLIVFTLNKTVVSYVNLPRNIVDFSLVRSIKLNKNEAIFSIDKTEDEIKLNISK